MTCIGYVIIEMTGKLLGIGLPDVQGTQPVGVIFRGDFETGTGTTGFGAFSPPWSLQDSTTNANSTTSTFGTGTKDTTIVGQGTQSCRFDLPASTLVKVRAQVITNRSVNQGGDDWYTLQYYQPSSFVQTGGLFGVSILEMNFQALTPPSQPTLALHAYTDHITLIMSTGVVATTQPYFQWNCNADASPNPSGVNLYAVPPGTMVPDVWHEFVIHAHWAIDSTGIVQIWHRVKGQNVWNQTVDFSGQPTLQVYPDGTIPTGTLDVVQAYRGPTAATTTLWFDNFNRCGDSTTAFAQFPNTPLINTVAPVVSGATTNGSTLSTTNGTWTGPAAPITYTYQWQRET